MTDTATIDMPSAPPPQEVEAPPVPKPKRQPKAAFELDPTRAAHAAKELRASIIAMYGEDDELVLDTIEGETELFEIIDMLIGRRAENLALAEGLDRHIASMKDRQDRFAKAAETDRTLITQALLLAEIPSLRRPVATLTIAARADKLVVDDEAAIPSDYWKTGEPKLDKAELGAALKAAKAAIAEAIATHGDDEEALAAALAAIPSIPGAHLEAAPPSLTIREK